MGYKFDPHKARSQISYLFCYNGITISWRSIKQTLLGSSTNHFKIIDLYEIGRECLLKIRYIAYLEYLSNDIS